MSDSLWARSFAYLACRACHPPFPSLPFLSLAVEMKSGGLDEVRVQHRSSPAEDVRLHGSAANTAELWRSRRLLGRPAMIARRSLARRSFVPLTRVVQALSLFSGGGRSLLPAGGLATTSIVIFERWTFMARLCGVSKAETWTELAWLFYWVHPGWPDSSSSVGHRLLLSVVPAVFRSGGVGRGRRGKERVRRGQIFLWSPEKAARNSSCIARRRVGQTHPPAPLAKSFDVPDSVPLRAEKKARGLL